MRVQIAMLVVTVFTAAESALALSAAPFVHQAGLWAPSVLAQSEPVEQATEPVEESVELAEQAAEPVKEPTKPEEKPRIDAKKTLGGLSLEEQRNAMRSLRMLKSPDSQIRNAGRNRLIEMARDVNMAGFLDEIMPKLFGYQIFEALDVLDELSSSKAHAVAARFVVSSRANQRVAALRLMAKTGKSKYSSLMARGMVDPDIKVRVAAARGLGSLGTRGATPLLIDGVNSNNHRMRLECIASLCAIWDYSPDEPDSKFPEFWTNYWEDNQSNVTVPIRVADLEPLSENTETDDSLISL